MKAAVFLMTGMMIWRASQRIHHQPSVRDPALDRPPSLPGPRQVIQKSSSPSYSSQQPSWPQPTRLPLHLQVPQSRNLKTISRQGNINSGLAASPPVFRLNLDVAPFKNRKVAGQYPPAEAGGYSPSKRGRDDYNPAGEKGVVDEPAVEKNDWSRTPAPARKVVVDVFPQVAAEPLLQGSTAVASPINTAPANAGAEGNGNDSSSFSRHKVLKFYFANITSFSTKARESLAELDQYHMLGLAETHTTSQDTIKTYANHIDCKSYQCLATPTVAHYSSGGTAILARKFLNTRPLPHMPFIKFSFAATLVRVQKLTILIASMYIKPGENHSDLLAQQLQQIGEVSTFLNMPFIIAADFNCTPNQLKESGFSHV